MNLYLGKRAALGRAELKMELEFLKKAAAARPGPAAA